MRLILVPAAPDLPEAEALPLPLMDGGLVCGPEAWVMVDYVSSQRRTIRDPFGCKAFGYVLKAVTHGSGNGGRVS